MTRDEYKEIIAEMYKSNATNNEMTLKTKEIYPEISYEKADSKLRYTLTVLGGEGKIERRKIGLCSEKTLKKENKTIENEIDIDKLPKSTSYNKDGSTTLEKVIALSEDTLVTPDLIMKAHNLDSHLWEVLSYKSNFWQAQKKGGQVLDLYQTKLTVKPKEVMELSIKDIDDYFKSVDFSIPKSEINKVEYQTDGDSLVIKVPDLHIGLLAWADECGNNYDLKIAKKNFLYCINDVINHCMGKKIKKIYFATLGDILHVDNDNQTTTKGTFQQVDGRMAKIIDCAEKMFIEAIEMLKKIAPVEVIYTSGNHDRLTGYMLIKMIENRYKNDDSITFNTLPNPIKMLKIGTTLIGFHHGDAPKKNVEDAIFNFGRDYISECKFLEMNIGHLHEFELKNSRGVQIRRFPELANSSYWEHQQLYADDSRCMVCDIYNDKFGRMETWQSNL